MQTMTVNEFMELPDTEKFRTARKICRGEIMIVNTDNKSRFDLQEDLA